MIEVNTNPCLDVCCPLLARVIPAVLEATMRVAVDPLCPPVEGFLTGTRKYVGGNEVSGEIKYELVWDGCKSVD